MCDGVNNCGNRKDEQQCHHLGYDLRLTGGETSNMGRVEVKSEYEIYNWKWKIII